MTMTLCEAALHKQLEAPARQLTISHTEYSEELRLQVLYLVRDILYYRHNITTALRFANTPSRRAAIGSTFDWKTEGSRLHKRVGNYIFKRFDVKLDDDALRRIAEMAAEERNTINGAVDATTNFTWRPGDFGDDGSCFFGAYQQARLRWLPRLGASAVRSFGADGKGNGRYWIFPLPILHEAHRDLPLYVAFNGYGALKDSDKLYYESMKQLAEDKWQRPFATTRITLSMENVYVNGDGRETLLHPADINPLDLPAQLRQDNCSDTLRPYDGDTNHLIVSIYYRTMNSVGVPVPDWTYNAGGKWCYGCDQWFYDSELTESHDRYYCPACE